VNGLLGGVMRVVIIGTGFGRQVMAAAYTALDDCSVVDIVSPRDHDAVRTACERHDVDLVSVHSPPFLHERDVSEALAGAHHVLCDKPLTGSAAGARRLLDAAEAAGVTHLTNFEFRWEPWRRTVADLIRSGVVGPVEQLAWHEHGGSWRGKLDGWQLERDSGGGWLGAAASHIVDTIMWWTGGPIAPTGAHLDVPAGGDRAEVGAAFVGELAGGGTVAVATTATAVHRLGRRVVVTGRDAVIEVVDPGHVSLHGRPWPNGIGRAPEEPPTMGDVVGVWVEHVRRAVIDRDAGAPTFVEGLAVGTVLDTIRRQAGFLVEAT
jgi:predicted dehydrogenase